VRRQQRRSVAPGRVPCPRGPGTSTGSSIVDTVFVCRSVGATARQGLCKTPDQLVALVGSELHQLRDAGRKPTAGDVRCIVYGHVTRLAVWTLRPVWDPARPTAEKLARVAKALDAFADLPALIEQCRMLPAAAPRPGRLFDNVARAERSRNAVSF
jgi:putative DNA methylase